ncbi:MAG: NrtA/SsuA/CpmA family ABC transporter substrate-binding protein [Paralcaligenes sp.]
MFIQFLQLRNFTLTFLRGPIGFLRICAALLFVAFSIMPTTSQGQALKRINVGIQPLVIGPLYIAIKEKYFERLGLEVNLIKFTSGPAQFAALAGGQVDLAWGGLGGFLLAKANGQDLNFISVLMDYNPLEALVVPANSPIKSIKDLAGRKVGLVIGSDAHYGIIKAMRANGMAPGSVTLLGMPPPQQIAALESGNIDAAYSWEPFLTPLYAKGARTLLTSSGWAYLGWAGKHTWLQANSDLIEKLLKGWNMGLEKMRQDPELAIRYTLEFTGMEPAQARAIFKGAGYFPSAAALDPKNPTYWAKGSALNRNMHDFLAFGREQGLVKSTADVDVDGYVMTKFMKATKGEK